MSPILALGSEGSAGSGLHQVESHNIPLTLISLLGEKIEGQVRRALKDTHA